MYNDPLLAQYASSSGQLSLDTEIAALQGGGFGGAFTPQEITGDANPLPSLPGTNIPDLSKAPASQVNAAAASPNSFFGITADTLARDTVFVLLAIVLVAVGAFALVEG